MANIATLLRSTLRSACSFSKNISRSKSSSAVLQTADDLSSLDFQQVQLLNEACIIVNENDQPIGAKSKLECHLMENINQGMVHRAFSVFLFNMKGDLLIQQRSDAKITFPGCFTNTCCSHPLHTHLELEEKDALGVKRAAQRRLQIELGIKPEQLQIEDFNYLLRIQYQAPSNGKWGESEIDYILVVQKDVDLKPNPNEVKNSFYVKKSDFHSFFSSLQKDCQQVTPWFRLITNSLLINIWENLDNLGPLKDHKNIHKM